MSEIIWPSTLPDHLQREGFSCEEPDTTVEVQPDAGPPETRRRFTCAPEPVSGRLLLSRSQLADFRRFFSETLAGGSRPFRWRHPVTGEPRTLRFVKPKPSYSPVGGAYFHANVNLVVLP